MKCVRGLKPDTANGGRIMNGEIVGPSIRTKHWFADQDPNTPFDTPAEARKAERIIEFRSKIHEALQTTTLPQGNFTRGDLVNYVLTRRNELKALFANKEFLCLFAATPKPPKIEQEKVGKPCKPLKSFKEIVKSFKEIA